MDIVGPHVDKHVELVVTLHELQSAGARNVIVLLHNICCVEELNNGFTRMRIRLQSGNDVLDLVSALPVE